MKYRAEIDGLRALAVVPVILFHAGFELFSGGFVGVDVFFVVSGYLITTILVEDIENKRFSIVRFYERRARRILPALFFVLIIVAIAGVLILPKESLGALSDSILATVLFYSNFYFSAVSGYFESNSLTAPLLHTWSLSIEEQYYLLFPGCLFFVWRFGKKAAFWSIFVVALISLIASEFVSRNDIAGYYYFTSTRIWELLSGSMVALIVHEGGLKKSNILSLGGLLLIVSAIFIYDETTPFPSVYALIPVVGSVLFIMYADRETLAAKFLSARIFVGIGLISYSAYLWHQPVLAYARLITFQDKLARFDTVLCLLLIFILAYVTFIFVETPFRKKSGKGFLSSKQVFVFAGSIFVLIVGLSTLVMERVPKMPWNNISNSVVGELLIHKKDGDTAWQEIGTEAFSNWSAASIVAPRDTKPSCSLLVLGDSHAGHLREGFSYYMAEKFKCTTHVLTHTGCTPLFGFYKVYGISKRQESEKQKACRGQVRAWENYLVSNAGKYDVVVFSSRWNWLVGPAAYHDKKIRRDALLPFSLQPKTPQTISDEDRKNNLRLAFKSTGSVLRSINQKAVFLSQPPVQRLDLRDYQNVFAYGSALPNWEEANGRNKLFENALVDSAIIDDKAIFYLNSFDLIYCPSETRKCKNRIGFKSLYNDDDHLSSFGSYNTADTLAKTFPGLFDF